MSQALSALRHLARCLVATGVLASAAAWCQGIEGTVVEVSTGDTLTIIDGSRVRHKIRLAGIDAPESRQPFGPESRKGLAGLVLGRQVGIERRKDDIYGRVVARVLVQPPDCAACPRNRDVALAQLEAGLAWWFRDERREQSLEEQGYYEYAEFDARARRIGLWRDAAPIPPWDWRKRQNKPVLTRRQPYSAQG